MTLQHNRNVLVFKEEFDQFGKRVQPYNLNNGVNKLEFKEITVYFINTCYIQLMINAQKCLVRNFLTKITDDLT